MANKIVYVIVGVVQLVAMLYLYPIWTTLINSLYDIAISLVPSMQVQDKFMWYIMPYVILGLIVFGGILYIINKFRGDSLNG
jgi:hypothetical protein